MTMIDRLYLSTYYVLKIIVSILPNFILKFLAYFVAKVVFLLDKKHRRIIDINLRICFKDLSKKARNKLSFKIYNNFANFGIDCLQNQNTTKEKVLKKVVFDDEESIKKALNSKRPLILTTAHYGNWELGSLAFAINFGPISVVSRGLDSKVMDKILSKNRIQFGIELIDKKSGTSVKQMLKALKNNRMLALLTDQQSSHTEGLQIKFFGQEVNFFMAASVIAKKTNALMIACFIYQKDNKYHIKSFETMDSTNHNIEELTLYQARCCEEMIKFKPDEYFFFHRRFDKKLYERDNEFK
ncbi:MULTISPECIES: lipid A biosynthesis lauroyl acyltransferase [unclassified Campylobacter]|uniref:lipid A biosynthesis lauroyl acyltransferase n=1 Tax=unclassified Campylobacter TaxID=2593542 RepID=UPI001680AD0D|nr:MULTISPECIES: lipid A biosynthesis lauroyl acyltransferase [unclassified Campylobacter]